jgi:hypothetical protein
MGYAVFVNISSFLRKNFMVVSVLENITHGRKNKVENTDKVKRK